MSHVIRHTCIFGTFSDYNLPYLHLDASNQRPAFKLTLSQKCFVLFLDFEGITVTGGICVIVTHFISFSASIALKYHLYTLSCLVWAAGKSWNPFSFLLSIFLVQPADFFDPWWIANHSSNYPNSLFHQINGNIWHCLSKCVGLIFWFGNSCFNIFTISAEKLRTILL